MQYRVVPFAASVSAGSSSSTAAAQLEALCQEQARDGFEFVSLETIETHVAGSGGCFGVGAKPPFTSAVSVAVFRK